MGPIQNLTELMAMLRRRAGLLALITVLGALASLFVALSSEPLYQARSVIQVQSPVLSPEEGSQISAARRLQQIEQRITARDYMLDLANRHDLFPELSDQDRVEAMRQSISLHSVAAVETGFGASGQIASLMIHARADTGQAAAVLANEMADTVMRMSTDTRAGRVRDSLAFFRTEEERLAAELDALEDEIEAFKIENFDLLPSNTAMRAQEVLQFEEQLRAVRREISVLSAEISELTESDTRATTQRRLVSLRDQLEMRQLEQRQLTEEIAEMQPMMRRLPQIERELAALERREEQLGARLVATSERRAQAELGARLEDDQQAERFELIESAIVPDYPISRSKRVTAMIGIVAAAGLAFVVAFVLEIFNPVLRTPSQLERAMGMQPVLTIPRIERPGERRRALSGWVAGMGLALLSAMAIILHLRQE